MGRPWPVKECALPSQFKSKNTFFDFYVIPLYGAELVLGVQWLQLLAPIVMDYQHLAMQFEWTNETIQLQGEMQF